MTDEQKLAFYERRKRRLEAQKERLECKVIDLETDIEDVERQIRKNPINVKKRQEEWDALPEDEKRWRRHQSDLMMAIMQKDLQPSPFVEYMTRGTAQWIQKDDTKPTTAL